MKIISFLSPKGSGKTTALINVAAYLAKSFKVAVVDTDPQQSLIVWNTDGKAAFDVFRLNDVTELSHLRASLAEYDYDFVMLDGFGFMHATMRASVVESDLIVIPVTPSPIDFSVATQMMDLIAGVETKASHHFLITRKVARAKMLSIVLANFERMGAPMLKSQLTQRQSFINSTLTNETVFDTRDRAARAEVEALAIELAGLVGVAMPEEEKQCK